MLLEPDIASKPRNRCQQQTANLTPKTDILSLDNLESPSTNASALWPEKSEVMTQH